MNVPIALGWVWAILPGSREWALMAVVALALFGRSPALRRRAVRWLRPWRDGGRSPDGRALVLVAVVAAAVTALLMSWLNFGTRNPP